MVEGQEGMNVCPSTSPSDGLLFSDDALWQVPEGFSDFLSTSYVEDEGFVVDPN